MNLTIQPARILVLAAGFGTRLRPLTTNTPKSLLQIGQTNILERLLSQIKATLPNSEIYINCSHLAGAMTKFIGTQPLSDRSKIIWEVVPLGTAVTTLNFFKSDPSRSLLVIHGDLVLSNAGLTGLEELFHSEKESFLMVHKRSLNRARSVVSTNGSKVTGIQEILRVDNDLSRGEDEVLVNSGILFFSPHSLDGITSPELGTEISPYLIYELSRMSRLGFHEWVWGRIAVDSLVSLEAGKELAELDPVCLK